jgi:excisionase family DNA binding protein
VKISYDKSSDALSIVFKKDRISKDVQLSPNVFAGLTRSGDLVEIQILEVSQAESPWFTLEAAAKYLGKSERTLLRWIKSGQLKSKKIGKEYRISPEDLDKLASP